MRIKLRSKVRGDKDKVYREFNQKLFMHLLPPGAKLLRFDGSAKGDQVHIKFGFPFFASWISEITEDSTGDKTNYFIDKGIKLPFGLKKWKHRHVVHSSSENESIIEDDMMYSTGLILLDLIFYPLLTLAFLPRIFQYKNYFGWPGKNR